jgi:hypothetical protein
VELWFHPDEVRRKYREAGQWIEAYVEGGHGLFPRGHSCYGCDRDLLLMCIAWAGIGIEAIGPAHRYTSTLMDMQTGKVAEPEEFMDTEAGRGAVWASRMLASVGNADYETIAALTDPELPELDTRAECLARGVAWLVGERRRKQELREIEAAVLADVDPKTAALWVAPPPPRPPMPWGWSSGDNR